MLKVNQPVKNAQIYLRRISYMYPSVPPVIPDGVYGEQTQAAVAAFQKEFGMPVNGEIDKATWDKMMEVYREVEKYYGAPRKVDIFPSPSFELSIGDVGATVSIVQAMVSALSDVFSNIDSVIQNGIYGTETAQAIMKIQTLAELDATGVTDKETWDILSLMYEFYVAKSRTAPIDKDNKYVIR
ncbi:MAG: peptidoglycan-binding domain-containing protein [Clostridia bacterium]|nr:peptidoglycan-binding domain-containing protein [Clostridia bacterium]